MIKLSKETNNKIDSLVKRVAKKSGYASKEISFEKYVQDYKKHNKADKSEFEEEIRTYLSDSIIDMMNEGMAEGEALEKTISQFDEAEFMPDMEEFMKEFNDFGMKMDAEWYAKHEAIGVFYGAFVVLGLVIGLMIGYIVVGGWINTIVSGVFGTLIGVGLGLLSQGIITFKLIDRHKR